MERDHHHQTPKPQNNPSQKPNKEIDSPRNGAAAKRDEWSEGAVSCLLEAYEAKWTLRNRAKLKGQDWEEVAKHVSNRVAGSKSAKTQTQCKNKIESMKKRYRSESAAAADASSWPLYPRLDLLLRGNGGSGASAAVSNPPPVVTLVEDAAPAPPPSVAPVEVGSGAPNADGSNDGDRLGKEEGDGPKNGTKIGNEELEKNENDETDSNTPPSPFDHFQEAKAKGGMRRNKGERKAKSKKRGRGEYWEIGESMRRLVEVVVRSEEARMKTIKEIERMRIEGEVKRGEMDLQRTQIIANTQLQIANIFATHEWKKPT